MTPIRAQEKTPHLELTQRGKTVNLDPRSPAFLPPPALPGGYPPKRVPPRPLTTHGAASHNTGPLHLPARPSLVATIAEYTSNELLQVILLLRIISTMASPNPDNDNAAITQDNISLWTAIWTSTILLSKLLRAPLDLTPISQLTSYLPLPSPGENYRRNCLSQRRFRRLRRVSKLHLTKSYLAVRKMFLQPDEKVRSTPPPAQVLPHPPTLTAKSLLARVN